MDSKNKLSKQDQRASQNQSNLWREHEIRNNGRGGKQNARAIQAAIQEGSDVFEYQRSKSHALKPAKVTASN